MQELTLGRETLGNPIAEEWGGDDPHKRDTSGKIQRERNTVKNPSTSTYLGKKKRNEKWDARDRESPRNAQTTLDISFVFQGTIITRHKMAYLFPPPFFFSSLFGWHI